MTNFSRRGIHGSVVDSLGRRIVTGKLAEGQTIDPDAIESELDVSRTVVREAFKVLTTKGLLDAKPRRGTYIRDRAAWQLLDADVMAWRGSAGPDARLLRELDEVRMIIEPPGARLAAQRRTDAELEEISKALDAMRAATDEPGAAISADLAFHHAILTATHNELLERFEVLLSPALQHRDALAFDHPHRQDFIESHAEVFAAIRAQRPKKALSAMTALLEMAARDTEHILRS